MSEQKRVTRGEPERSAPHRSASMVVRPASAHAAPRRRAKGVVEQGVENAYRVYEEYMRRGREAASELGRLGSGRRRGDEDLRGTADQALRYLQDMAGMWLSLVSPAGPGRGRGGRRARGRGGERARDDAEHDGHIDLSVALRSTRPVEVTLDLREASPDAALAVQQLHALGGDGVHRISGVSFDRPDGRLRLHLPVPADIPSGAYFAVVVDKVRGEAVGTLRVVIRPA